jgi:hypothetical protein
MDISRCIRTLSVAVITLLLPATARAQTRMAGVSRTPSAVTLDWLGGYGPWLVESSRDLTNWCDHGDLASSSNRTLSAFARQQFYRVADVNPTNGFGAFFGLLESEQGESGALLGRHRLKSRLWLYKTRGSPHTSPSATPANYWRKLLVNYQWVEEGRVRTWTGPLETLGNIATPAAGSMTVAWTRGTGPSLRTFLLTLDFPYNVNSPRSVFLPSDPNNMALKCTYATPQPELNPYSATLNWVTNDTTSLAELAPDAESWWPTRNYRVSKNGVQVTLNYLEGLPLYQGSPPFIFKTFILSRWLSPSTGGGGSLPDFSTDSWFARTLLPGHHNFTETVLLEPALDPALSETTRAALASANVRYIQVFKDHDIGLSPDDILFIGHDNTVRSP